MSELKEIILGLWLLAFVGFVVTSDDFGRSACLKRDINDGCFVITALPIIAPIAALWGACFAVYRTCVWVGQLIHSGRAEIGVEY